MAAGMLVLETADVSKEVRHEQFEDLWRLPDTVTAGEASVCLATPSMPQPRPAPSRAPGECERIA
jgi:hypothetical protein